MYRFSVYITYAIINRHRQYTLYCKIYTILLHLILEYALYIQCIYYYNSDLIYTIS